MSSDRPVDTRWRKAPGCKWETGWFRAVNEDTTIEVIDSYTGAQRTIFVERVEFKGRGPKGGTVWVSAEGAERPIAPGS